MLTNAGVIFPKKKGSLSRVENRLACLNWSQSKSTAGISVRQGQGSSKVMTLLGNVFIRHFPQVQNEPIVSLQCNGQE